MATVKYGASISDARGSVGGTVMSRNLGGAYTRARVAPVNRRTPAQTQVRANFAAGSKMWSGTLTASQRAAWALFAQANPVPNRLGDSIILSGLAVFLGLNQTLATIGFPPILDAPSDLSVPAMAAVTGFTLTSPSAAVEAITDSQSVVVGARYYIEATGLLSAGRTPPSSGYRFMTTLAGIAAATTASFVGQWTTKFGVGVAGGTTGLRISTVNTATGARTPAQIFIGTWA